MQRSLIAAAILGLLGSGAWAANTDVVNINLAVNEITELSTGAPTITMTVTAATAGQQPVAVTDSSTAYAVTTNGTKKITAAINTAMPAGTTLGLSAVAPTGGTAVPIAALTTTAQDLVTGVQKVAESGKTLTFTLSATVDAGVVASTARVVTLTLTNPS